MQCAVLAGGLATRMRPLTEATPKVLLPVAGVPFVHWQLDWLAREGVEHVVYCIGHLGDRVRAYVGDGSRWGISVRYSEDGERLRGTAGALAHAARGGLLDECFLVTYGDSYLTVAVRRFWDHFQSVAQPMLLAVYRNDGRLERSNIRFREGVVELYDKGVEFPAAIDMHHVDYGLIALDRATLLREVPPDASQDLSDVQHRLSLLGEVAGFEVGDRFYEVGSPTGLADLNDLLSRERRSE
jgi:NDP-sugar pyrophosphorylase family protein